MCHIRGLAVDKPEASQRKRIFVANSTKEEYQALTYPQAKPWNKGQIKKWIAEQLSIPVEDVNWPEFLKVPKA
jgi:hypothetical protein